MSELKSPPSQGQKHIGNRLHYKFTRLCTFYQSGTCSRGLNCSFAHSRDGLRQQPDFFKTRLCEDFRRGSCTAGPNCNFAHGSEEMKRVAHERRHLRKEPNQLPLDVRPGGASGFGGDYVEPQVIRREKSSSSNKVSKASSGHTGGVPRPL
ncbi:unnamed protein product [Durusdinium trenchii]|uniref:C3H1-type domain-containing protein n=1 Tax=Durusdinium trenchii TaxID=1381693 RepID=A0ABP0NQB9_9DINO